MVIPSGTLRVSALLLLALAAAWPAAAEGRRSGPAACAPTLAARLAPGGAAKQLVTVVAPRSRATSASLRLWRRAGPCWRPVAGPWRARVGRTGLSAHHREGDGTTPTGAYGLEPTVYGVAADPGVRFRYHRLVCGDWWDEDPSSPTYNTFRHVRCGVRPRFGGGSEALWLQTRAYRYFAVLAYNSDPAVPGRGSAIFLHADTGAATNGCISLPLGRLLTTLRWLRPAARPLIAIAVAGTP